MSYGLSKSRLIEWRQCPKRLWLKIHCPELAEVSSQTERSFRIGDNVGEVARSLYPDGVLIESGDLKIDLTKTQEVLKDQPATPVFEATLERDGVLIRADLLLPEADGYRMVEVKSATWIKDYYLEDAAIQRWVVGDTVRLTGADIAHIDRDFVYPGNEDYRGLFKQISVEEEIARLEPEVPGWVNGARKTLAGAEPEVEPGEHCSSPFECPFSGYCNQENPEPGYPISVLPYLSSGKRERLEALGIDDVRQIPDDFDLTDNQARVRRITRDGCAELLPDAAEKLSALPWPRYYLDFETVFMAVPVWANSRPYQQIPVQWSCHVETEDGAITHHSFLASGFDDPRRRFAESLCDVVGTSGPVFVYKQSFEGGRIAELAGCFPDLSDALNELADRVIDLLPLTVRNYYHPDMRGSWSIKSVLPTICPELDYTSMEVGDGGTAMERWLEIFHPETPEPRRESLRKALAEYCELDTLAMVRVAHFLSSGTKS